MKETIIKFQRGPFPKKYTAFVRNKKTHKIIAANLNGLSASTYIFSDKCVLVLSNEAHGISDQYQNFIEDYIFIDKIGSGNSLNVSAAGSILMYLMMKC